MTTTPRCPHGLEPDEACEDCYIQALLHAPHEFVGALHCVDCDRQVIYELQAQLRTTQAELDAMQKGALELNKHLSQVTAERDEAQLRLRDAAMLLRRCLNSGIGKPISEDVRAKSLSWIERHVAGSVLRVRDEGNAE